MESSAAEIHENDGASLEGLDEVFSRTSEPSEAPESAQPKRSEEFGSTPSEVITTEEAARRLGISARAVINRLKAGSLAGKKTKGRFKEEWRVLWSMEDNSTEGSEVYSEVTSEPVAEDSPSSEEESMASQNNPTVLYFSEQLRALTEQTQALSFRNGYLEAQLEASRAQVKLLPDYQSKATENEILKAKIQDLEARLEERSKTWWQRLFRASDNQNR